MIKFLTFTCFYIFGLQAFGAEENLQHVFGVVLKPDFQSIRAFLNQEAYPLSYAKANFSTQEEKTIFILRLEIEEPSIVEDDQQEEFHGFFHQDLQKTIIFLDSKFDRLTPSQRNFENIFSIFLSPAQAIIKQHVLPERIRESCVNAWSENGKRIISIHMEMDSHTSEEDDRLQIFQRTPYTSPKIKDTDIFRE